MLTLLMGRPSPSKATDHPWPAHAFFYKKVSNGLKFRVEFIHLQALTHF